MQNKNLNNGEWLTNMSEKKFSLLKVFIIGITLILIVTMFNTNKKHFFNETSLLPTVNEAVLSTHVYNEQYLLIHQGIANQINEYCNGNPITANNAVLNCSNSFKVTNSLYQMYLLFNYISIETIVSAIFSILALAMCKGIVKGMETYRRQSNRCNQIGSSMSSRYL